MPLEIIGAVGIGLVWGWLLATTPVPREWSLLGTAKVAAGIALLLAAVWFPGGRAAALGSLAGMAFGVAAQVAFHRLLERRIRSAPSRASDGNA